MEACQDRWASFFNYLNKASKQPFTEDEVKKQSEFFGVEVD